MSIFAYDNGRAAHKRGDTRSANPHRLWEERLRWFRGWDSVLADPQRDPTLEEQFEILRRVGERGLSLSRPAEGADGGDSAQLDLWQHMLDELQRTKVAYERTI